MMENIPLLKSIENKDPSLNWNIDVSAELEKYLSAIELLDEDMNYSQSSEVNVYRHNSENISGSNGSYMQLFNFVEAALIIQNSTSLYSKKIEHLHSLVFDTFHLLSTGKSQLTDVKSGSDEHANLSSQLNNKTNIAEKSTAFLMSNIVSVPINLLQPGKNINLSYEQFENSWSDETKTKYSSYSSYIGVSSLGSNISLPQYRIDTASNTLFLDEADLGYFSSSFSVTEDEYLGNLFEEQTMEHENFQEDGKFYQIQESDEVYNFEIEGKDENEHIDVEIDGMEIEIQDYIEVSENPENEVFNSVNDKGKQATNNIAGGRREKNKEDYWVFMDEHMKIGKDKPLKLGKTYKIPSRNYTISLEGLSQKEDILDFIDVYTLSSYFMGLTEIGGEKYKVGTQKLPYFSDLKPPKLSVEKLLILDSPDNDFLRSLEPEFNESISSWKKYHSKIFFSNMEKKRKELLNHDSGNIDNDQEVSEFNEPVIGEASEYDIDQTQDVLSDSELALDSIEDPIQDDENLMDDGQNQEEQIHFDSNIKDITDFEQDLSELHERVNTWTVHVEPLLMAQNSRPEFNIHEEGKKIIEMMKKVSAKDQQPIKFEEVTSGFSKWQVCRSFLATLMLSNNREIDILHEEQNSSDRDLDFFSIRLLDEKEKNEMLNTNLPNIEKVSKAKLDFPRKKKTKKDTINLEEDNSELENKLDKSQKIYRKRGNKA
ncbi:uncharacterized protein cubi_00909 [Cryptosporidium ubiquitum]|uniref:Condensin-2 complex subunit H2 C-terminal domain-containing protein n=1 Tax=Cryptosporidium ubiquitum TaxID=857276 RepID=A0A1J4MCL7_9CRYT|nr:uncharacterized protein cubi_00909 [Cryptosporidium ubiquitum]OII70764.1 hypothetical protein cubi_00909 [Cryptosporidium ubiquitum]